MATVTGYTAERMKAIEDNTIVDGDIVGSDLILKKHDGSEINAGVVVGPTGAPGVDGVDGATGPTGPMPSFGGYVEPILDLGGVSGTVTLDFAVSNIWKINPIGAVTLAFANLPDSGDIASGTLIVTHSTYAITWPAGTKFNLGNIPALDGETWLSLVANSVFVTAGVTWTLVA